MARTPRLLARRFFVLFNGITAVVFLLACLAPYLHPSSWWPISFLGLGFFILLLVLILFIFFWLVFKPRYIFISLISLLLGLKSISVFFAVNNPDTFKYAKPADVLRVVHWNVARFTEWKRNNNKGSQTRLKMMDLLREQNADVLCLQEFFHSSDSVYYDNLNHVMKEIGYPYYYYSWDDDGWKQWVGQIIFSRFPIVDSGMIRFPKPGMPEALLHADIKFGKDTIRFFTTHLQSFQFKKKDYESLEEIRNREDSLISNSKSIFSKLKKANILRSGQADIVKETTRQSPYPYIITGDLNDIPNSYTYHTIAGDLQDAFLKKGFGIGRTYTGISPTLRIDYIFATKDFTITQFNRMAKEYSDHYMLVADVKMKKRAANSE